MPHTIAYHLSPKCAPIRTFILYHLPKAGSRVGSPQACLPLKTPTVAKIKHTETSLPACGQNTLLRKLQRKHVPFRRLPSSALDRQTRPSGRTETYSGEQCQCPCDLPSSSSFAQEYFMYHCARCGMFQQRQCGGPLHRGRRATPSTAFVTRCPGAAS